MSDVLLSFIIPVKNRENTICYCLDSILCQAFICNFEIILVDDASTDKTPIIIKQIANTSSNKRLLDLDFCSELPETSALFSSITIKEELEIRARIKTIYLNSNKGAAVARNVGINNAKGKYIWFVDSDDFISIDALDVLKSLVLHNNFDVVKFAKRSLFLESPPTTYRLLNSYQEPQLFNVKYINELLFVLGHGAVWCSIFNREFIDKIRFNPNFEYSEDSLFTWQTVLNAQNIAYLNYPLYGYMYTCGSLTSTKPYIRFKCYVKVIEEYLSVICTSSKSDKEKQILIKECEKRLYSHVFYTYSYDEITQEMWDVWYCVYRKVMLDNKLRPKYKRLISRFLYTIHCNKIFKVVFTILYGKGVNCN